MFQNELQKSKTMILFYFILFFHPPPKTMILNTDYINNKCVICGKGVICGGIQFQSSCSSVSVSAYKKCYCKMSGLRFLDLSGRKRLPSCFHISIGHFFSAFMVISGIPKVHGSGLS